MRIRLAIGSSPAAVIRAAALALVVAATAAASATAQSLSPDLAARFDRGDRLARELITTIRCAGSVAQARADGLFGPVDSLGRNGQCVRAGGAFVGVFFDADSLFTHATRFSAVDLRTRSRRIAPLDTIAVLAVARAELAGQRRGVQAYEDADREYGPIAFRFDGDSIQVWLIPAAVLMGSPLSVGGERGYVFSPDGQTLVREIDSFADFRPVTVPDTGTVYLTSRGGDVPSMSEFLLANVLNARGRVVSIAMPWGQSVLAGRGAQAMWMQVVK